MASGDSDHIEMMESGVKKTDNATGPSGSEDDGNFLNPIIQHSITLILQWHVSEADYVVCNNNYRISFLLQIATLFPSLKKMLLTMWVKFTLFIHGFILSKIMVTQMFEQCLDSEKVANNYSYNYDLCISSY